MRHYLFSLKYVTLRVSGRKCILVTSHVPLEGV